MYVNILTVGTKRNNNYKLKILIKLISESMPLFFQSYCSFCYSEYILCIDSAINEQKINELLKEHGFTLLDVYKMQIHSQQYNNNYKPFYSYDGLSDYQMIPVVIVDM